MRVPPPRIKTICKPQSHLIFAKGSRAHQYIGLRTVAFDVILSEQGAVILEANFNWIIEILYQIIDPEQGMAKSKHPLAQWIRELAEL